MNQFNSQLVELFDAVTGGDDGSAEIDGWRSMTYIELLDQVQAQDSETYKFDLDFDCFLLIADACLDAQSCESSAQFFNIRKELSQQIARHLAPRGGS